MGVACRRSCGVVSAVSDWEWSWSGRWERGEGELGMSASQAGAQGSVWWWRHSGQGTPGQGSEPGGGAGRVGNAAGCARTFSRLEEEEDDGGRLILWT